MGNLVSLIWYNLRRPGQQRGRCNSLREVERLEDRSACREVFAKKVEQFLMEIDRVVGMCLKFIIL